MNGKLEMCIECDEETGRAGRYEDSLYIEFSPIGDAHGPLCEACYDGYVLNDPHATPQPTKEGGDE